MKAALITLLSVGVIAAGFALISHGDGKGKRTRTAPPSSAPSLSTDNNTGEPMLTINVDDTISIEPDVRKLVLDNLSKQLPDIIERGHYQVVKISHFGKDGWFSQEKPFLVPHLDEQPCTEAENLGDTAIFKQANDLAKKRAEQKCKEKQERAKQDFKSQSEKFWASIRQALYDTPSAAANCTSFYDVLARSSLNKKTGRTIIVSDTIETCKQTTAAIPAPAPGVEVVVLLVPGKDDLGKGRSGFESFSKRKDHLAQVAPWVKVESPNTEVD